MPQKYAERRSCTDIVFAIVFVVFLGLYVVLGAISFKSGDLKGLLRGSDYLGYRCGEGAGPKGFADAIPDDAPFQSKDWSKNTYLWYPMSLEKNLSSLLDVRKYLSLGVCVKTCPKVNLDGLKGLYYGNQTDFLKSLQLYSYGTTAADGVTVNAASNMYAIYDTMSVGTRCFPSAKQPINMMLKIPSPMVGKVFDFLSQGINEVQKSWLVILIEAFVAVIVAFVFILLIRCCVGLVVWLMLVLVFFLLAGISGISFLLYYTKGQSTFFKVSGVESYSTHFLVLSIVFSVLALVYLFVVIAISKKVRFVCAILKISGRVMGSAPSVLLVPIVTSILMLVVCVWALLIAISVYNSKQKGASYSLVHVTDAVKYDNSALVEINKTKFFNVTTRVLNSPHTSKYLMLANLFGFLWTMAFLGAFCFTVIAFTAVFWYFSNTADKKKSVSFFSVVKAVLWTLFYHTGTLALGSLLVAIIQFIRCLLSYFAKKARSVSGEKSLVACILCCAQCFLHYFEHVIETINKNAYVMTCITAECFCFSAFRAVELILGHAVELLFLSWFIDVIIFFGKLFVIGSCCVSAYFLLSVEQLASGIEVKLFPIIVIGFLSYFLSSMFFNVYSAAASALVVCYCYDRTVNASNGVFYVPAQLEHRIAQFSRKEKAAQMNERQAAVHYK